jgi:hypothetical protein
VTDKNTEQTVRIFYGRSDIRGLGPDARLYPCGEKPLPPFNTVPLKSWDLFKDHPQIKGLIADGSIRVLDEIAASPAPAVEQKSADEGKPARRAKTKPEAAKPPAASPAPAVEQKQPEVEPPAPPPGSETEAALKSLGIQ